MEHQQNGRCRLAMRRIRLTTEAGDNMICCSSSPPPGALPRVVDSVLTARNVMPMPVSTTTLCYTA